MLCNKCHINEVSENTPNNQGICNNCIFKALPGDFINGDSQPVPA